MQGLGKQWTRWTLWIIYQAHIASKLKPFDGRSSILNILFVILWRGGKSLYIGNLYVWKDVNRLAHICLYLANNKPWEIEHCESNSISHLVSSYRATAGWWIGPQTHVNRENLCHHIQTIMNKMTLSVRHGMWNCGRGYTKVLLWQNVERRCKNRGYSFYCIPFLLF